MKESNPANEAGRDERDNVKCCYNGRVVYVPKDIFFETVFGCKIHRNRRYVRYKEGAKLYGISERKFNDIAHESGAVLKLDNIALVELSKVDRYIERNAE